MVYLESRRLSCTHRRLMLTQNFVVFRAHNPHNSCVYFIYIIQYINTVV